MIWFIRSVQNEKTLWFHESLRTGFKKDKNANEVYGPESVRCFSVVINFESQLFHGGWSDT